MRQPCVVLNHHLLSKPYLTAASFYDTVLPRYTARISNLAKQPYLQWNPHIVRKFHLVHEPYFVRQYDVTMQIYLVR